MKKEKKDKHIFHIINLLVITLLICSIFDLIWSSSNDESLVGNLSSIGPATVKSMIVSTGISNFELLTTRYFPIENFSNKLNYFLFVFTGWLFLFLPSVVLSSVYAFLLSRKHHHNSIVVLPISICGSSGVISGLIIGALFSGKVTLYGWLSGLMSGLLIGILFVYFIPIDTVKHFTSNVIKKITSLIVWIFLAVILVSFSVSLFKSTSFVNSGPNLLLIVIDTLREDALGMYGRNESSSPFIDRYFSKGIQIKGIRSNSSWTAPSFASLFTGEHPRIHGVIGGGNQIPSNMETLAGILSDHGYFTCGLVCNPVIPAEKGYDNGFHWYDNRIDERTASHTVAAARSLIPTLRNQDKFFLLLQFMDCHQPYNPLIRYDGRLMDHLDENIVSVPHITDRHKDPFSNADLEEIERYHCFYQAGLKHVDTAIQELFQSFHDERLLENTLIVVTSDHGEEFHEHGSLDHCATLYEEVVRIPMIMRYPNVTPKLQRLNAQLSDLGSTLLRKLSFSRQLGNGRDFFNSRTANRPILLDTHIYGFAIGGVIVDEYKYIAPMTRVSERPIIHNYFPRPWRNEEIYNLRTDPEERRIISISDGDYERMRQLWERLSSDVTSESWDQDSIDTRSLDALKELGYIQ